MVVQHPPKSAVHTLPGVRRCNANVGTVVNVPVRVGSDFSGLDTVLLATKKVCGNIGKTVVHTHACDKLRACKKLSMTLHPPHIYIDNILERCTESLPSCDIYSFTAPCTSYSVAGKMEGAGNRDGKLLFKALEFIQLKKPKVIISENAPTLAGRFKSCSDVLIGKLEEEGYRCQTGILETDKFGLPQTRRRWYLLAINKLCLRKNDIPFGDAWLPEPRPGMIPLSCIVSPVPKSSWLPYPPHKLAKQNVLAAYRTCCKKNVNPFTQPVVVDCGSSPRYSSFKINLCMTLTKTRCSGFGYWHSMKGAPLSVEDMMRLQGFEPTDFGNYSEIGVSHRAMAGCLGNAQSLNVVMKLIPRALFLAKLISRDEYFILDASTW